MTDKQLLQDAARAAGYAVAWNDDYACMVYTDRFGFVPWRPDAYKEDALTLAERLKINIDFQDCSVWHRFDDGRLVQDYWGGDYDPSFMLALVRCAAAIGRGE